MRVTIVPIDETVIVDGRAITGIDMSNIDSEIHAVQWGGEGGEIEYVVNSEGIKPPNMKITDLAQFQPQLNEWTVKRDAQDAPPQPPSQEFRIAMLQTAYDADRDNLNKAWLSALIADGAEETARKLAIQGQMDALDAQLEADILAILTEG